MSSPTQNEIGLLQKLMDEANAFILYLDPAGRIILCNKKIEEVAGKFKTELFDKPWQDVLYPQDHHSIKQQMFNAVLEETVGCKRPNNFESIIADRNSSERLVSWSLTPIMSGTKAIEGILLIGNDVTDLRQREDSHKLIDQTLKDILSSIKEYALYVINLDGNITYFGMGSESMFGWQKNEIIFKHVSVLHPQEEAISKLPIILAETKRLGEYEIEINLMKKTGESFPVILSASLLFDSDKKTIGFIFIAKDITEKKKLEYQVFQSEKLAALGQLSANLAHEINNPIFVISGRLEILLQETNLSKELRDNLNIINSQADRIRKLVDRLLQFSRPAPLNLERISINEVIDGVLPLLSYHKLPANVTIEKELAESLSYVKGDLNQLQEVFINLFVNAYQAMPDGGKLFIKTSNFKNLFAEIQITDTGCGIPAMHLKNIFMPFFSTKKDGTGLGLPICHNIIGNHGGSINVESRPNMGTTFVIRLPFA